MSGGFFRGTSADQDTRFSNKQAKLLKSQKFAPELEYLVDVTKVKMDVIRPWIATRATELLGFEDEVLINFIYGLLEGKEVDGKQIQIQLTGFMEKNTGKFMRELWGLLLSAQKNASGVPQQFLDAKEEEMKKKKVETDRITHEIQKRKERGGWESEQDRKSRMDGQIDIPGPTDLSRNANFDGDAVLEQSSRRSMSVYPEDEVGRRSSRRMSSTPSPARSSSRSFSNSRSHSRGRHSSRSPSISPPRKRHADSHEMRYRSPPRRSFSPRQIARSPSRRRSPRFRRRSSSRTCYRSPPLVRRRTPERRRTLERRSSPSLRYGSPPSSRRSSPSLHRRSPVHSLRKSPSPLRRRSPMQHRTPPRRRSPSPLVRRSPPFRSPRGRSKSPTRRKMDSQSSPHRRNRSHRLSEIQSPPSRSRRSLSGGPDSRVSRYESGQSRDGYGYRRSPVRRPSEREEVKIKNSGKKGAESVSRKQPISLRSPQRDPRSQRDALGKEAALSALAENSESPFQELSLKAKEKREGADHGKLATNRPKETQDHSVYRKMSSDHKMSYEDHSERPMRKNSLLSDEIENGSRRLGEESFSPAIHDKQLPEQEISPRNGRPYNQQSLLKSPTLKGSYKSDDIKQKYYNEHEHSFGHHSFMETKGKTGHNIKEGLINSDSEDDARYKRKVVERTKRSDIRKEASDEEGNDSQVDEKEAKRRRKDEKRLRKEEKRRKREERHRKKEERRAERRAKYIDTVTPPSDYDKSQNAADDSDGDVRKRRNIHPSDTEEAESQQKKLEIALREKALESLRAKKAVTH